MNAASDPTDRRSPHANPTKDTTMNASTHQTTPAAPTTPATRSRTDASTAAQAELSPGPSTAPASRLRQLRALAGAETRELLRNKVALFNSLGLPLLMGLVILGFDNEAMPVGVYFPIMVTGTAILFVVYYTLVTAVVARRESLLLKRLRSGEADDVTILMGIALPFVVVTVVQYVVAVVLAQALFDVSLSMLTAVAGLGVLLAAVAFAALAVASTTFTRTVEHAQISTLPVILVPLVFSGMMFPLPFMPDAMRAIAELMPLTPVIELLHLGIGGVTVDGEAVTTAEGLAHSVKPLLVLVAWIVLGTWFTRRMVWEPRS